MAGFAASDPARVVEVATVNGRNSWRNTLRGILAGHDTDHPDLVLTTDRELHSGPPPGRVNRLWNRQDGGMLFPMTHSWPPFLDVAHVPHVPIVRAPQRMIPRTISDNTVQIPATYVGNPT